MFDFHVTKQSAEGVETTVSSLLSDVEYLVITVCGTANHSSVVSAAATFQDHHVLGGYTMTKDKTLPITGLAVMWSN